MRIEGSTQVFRGATLVGGVSGQKVGMRLLSVIFVYLALSLRC